MEKCFIEIKNVTYRQDHAALFPDAVTTRGRKHLNALVEAKKAGYRAVMFFLVQRSDVRTFAPAIHIDIEYSKALQNAISNGVEVLVYQTHNTPPFITIESKLPAQF